MITDLADERRVAARATAGGRNDAAAVAPSPIRRNERRSISMPRHEFGRVEERPEEIFVRLGAVALPADPLEERRRFLRRRRPGQREKEELLDPLRRVLLLVEDSSQPEGAVRRGRARGELAVQEPECLGDRG